MHQSLEVPPATEHYLLPMDIRRASHRRPLLEDVLSVARLRGFHRRLGIFETIVDIAECQLIVGANTVVDILIDISRNDCEDKSSTFCIDPTPFTVDGEQIVEFESGFGERISWISEDDPSIGGYFWTQHFRLKQQETFLLGPTNNTKTDGLMWAVSFRVANWINGWLVMVKSE
ncbi:unnamed protein product, partial [Mesorhabditis belari]|uniref:Uncharacterized protein n=1 Tax=Mesorhabditis belari TaxID=2138241 RepID=A0AAF3ELQ8_9BILA